MRTLILVGIVALTTLLVTPPANAQGGTVIASDNFNRPDESPFAVGGNWGRVIAGNYDGVSNLTNNRVTSVSNEGIYYWTGPGTFDSTRQFARETVVQKDGELGLVLLGGPDQAIMIGWGPPGVNDTVYIYWYSGGQDRGQLSVGPSTVQNGDVIEAVLEADVIYAKVNGVTVRSVANTTSLTSGRPGFITYLNPSLPGYVSILDDWEAGTPAAYTIGGTITEDGAGLGGVLLSASGGFSGSATTDVNGAYTITGVPPGTSSIVLTPTLSGHTMSPLSRTVPGPVNANVSGQDFTSTLNTGAILTIHATHGSVTRDPDEAEYAYGTLVTLTPFPDEGYDFAYWSGNVPVGHATDNPLHVTMDQDRTITAHFVAPGVVASDHFDRSDEFPLAVGGNWQQPFMGGFANLIGNELVGASGEALYYWQGVGTFDDTRQYVRARVVQAGGQVGLVLLGAPNQALVVSWGSGRLYVYWFLNGSYQGELANVPSTLQDGDEIEGLLDQGRIYAKINGVVVTSLANTTSLSAGKPGFETYLAGAVIDDWEAGVPSNFSISGTITENATGLSGVAVTASGGFSGSATTDVNGTYTISGVPFGVTSVLLTPKLFGHTMVPLTRTVAGPVTGDVSAQDFAGTPNAGAILTIDTTHGSVTKVPDLPAYAFAQDVTLTPVADLGYRFAGWVGDVPVGHQTDDPLHVTMDQDRTITAIFVSAEVVAWDYFNRADESPLLVGGNWQQPFASGSVNLIDSRVVSASGDALYYWQGAGTFDNTRQFARARVVQATGEVGLVLLGATNQALVLSWRPGHLDIYWYQNGVHQGNLVELASTLAAGDEIEAVLDQGTIHAKVNGVVVASLANTTTLSSGRPGFQMFLTGGMLDDWEAGILAVTCVGAPSGTPCDDGNECTAGDTCGAGSCLGVAVQSPAEIQGVLIDGQNPRTLTWTGVSGALYDVASATLSDLVSNGTATATCLSNDGSSASYLDERPDPAQGDGYYYLIRAQGSCGPGTFGFGSGGSERLPAAACP